MGLTLLFQLVLLGFTVLFAALSASLYVYVNDRLHGAANQILPGFGVILLGAWLLVWLVAVFLAARGSTRRIPVVAALGRGRRRRLVAAVVAAVGYIFAVVVLVVTVHSTTLARTRDGLPARVYVLYDEHAVNLGPTPRWVLTLASYRIGHATRDRWGPDHLVVDRISPAALREALLHGEVVILATHGRSGEVYYNHGHVFSAKQVRQTMPRGPRLKLVYLTACGGGHALSAWRRALHPAKVISYARNSSTSEHAWWLWTRAPRRIQQLK